VWHVLGKGGGTGGGSRVREWYNNNTARQIVDRGGALYTVASHCSLFAKKEPSRTE